MTIVKARFVHDMRTIPVDHPDHRSRIVENQFARQLRFANQFYDGISLITAEMRQHIEQKYVQITKPLCIWESGVDTSIFKPLAKNISLKRKLGLGDDDFVCFYHGVFSDKRGIIELVESFAIIKQKEKNIKLFILGLGNSYTRVLGLIDNLHLDDTVKLHDWVPYDEVPEYISIADLCIIPLPDIDWWRVSSPLKLMEYIACGKNILLTEIVAHTSVVGINSSYFWIKDVRADTLAVKVLEARESFTLDRAHFYERGMKERQKLVDHISWENRSKRLEEFLATFNQRD
jgi:glycosyltransferase involved in cell wall biosynthesis